MELARAFSRYSIMANRCVTLRTVDFAKSRPVVVSACYVSLRLSMSG
jgi:hypothetical protein